MNDDPKKKEADQGPSTLITTFNCQFGSLNELVAGNALRIMRNGKLPFGQRQAV